jgi:hypothetical protein
LLEKLVPSGDVRDTAPMRQTSNLEQRCALGLLATLAVPLMGSCLLFGCTQPGERDAVEGIDGTLIAYTARFDDGVSETSYALRVGEDERPLVFEEPPTSKIGDTVRVWGPSTEQGIEVERLEVLSESASTGRLRQPLIGAEPFPARTFALALVDIGGGVNIDPAEATATIPRRVRSEDTFARSPTGDRTSTDRSSDPSTSP